MADPKTYAIQLGAWLAKAIGDNSALFVNFTTEHLGLNLPPPVVQAAPVAAALTDASATARNVGTAGDDLNTAATSGDEMRIVAAFVKLGLTLIQFFGALDKLASAVRANATPATVPDPAARAATQQFADELAKILS